MTTTADVKERNVLGTRAKVRREGGRKASTAAVRLFPPPSAVSIEYKFPPLELSHSIDRVHVCVRNWEEATTTWREVQPNVAIAIVPYFFHCGDADIHAISFSDPRDVL